MVFPINCGLSERITFEVPNCAQRGSFCLHRQPKQQEGHSQELPAPLCIAGQLRGSSDVKQALSPVTLQGHKNSPGELL